MRSGSTLTETMLDAHKNIFGMGEETLFATNEIHNILIKHQGKHSSTPSLIHDITTYGKNIENTMLELGRKSLDLVNKSKDLKHVVDKNLFNYFNIGLINYVFPNAMIIHCVRDPLDTILSIYKNKLGDQEVEWGHHAEDLVYEYIHYLLIVAHFDQLLPGRIYHVSYEELIKDPELIMRDIIVNKLKLNWDSNVMDFYKTNRTIQTLSMTQVRQNIYTKSIGGWRRYATQMQPFIEGIYKYII